MLTLRGWGRHRVLSSKGVLMVCWLLLSWKWTLVAGDGSQIRPEWPKDAEDAEAKLGTKIHANLDPDARRASEVPAQELSWSVTSGSCTLQSDGCISSSGYPNSYPNNDFCNIQVSTGNRKSLQVLAFNVEAYHDRLVVDGFHIVESVFDDIVPQDSLQWTSDGSVTASGWKICLVVTILSMSCDFESTLCSWLASNTPGSMTSAWTRVNGADTNIDGSGWYLRAASNSSQDVVLESVPDMVITDKLVAFSFGFQISGSEATTLQLDCQASENSSWLSLWTQHASQISSSWQDAIVVVPAGTARLRLLARLAEPSDMVGLDSVQTLVVVPSAENASCNFDEDACGWICGGQAWKRNTGETPSWGTGPRYAAEGSHYIYLESTGREHQAGICLT